MLYLCHTCISSSLIQLCPQTLPDEDSNTLTSPPKTPPGAAELSTSSSLSGSRRSCQRRPRCLRSASSPSPEARRSHHRYRSPAPHSGFSLPPQLSFPAAWHCPRNLTETGGCNSRPGCIANIGVSPPPPPIPPPLPPPSPQLPMGSASYNAPVAPTLSPPSGPLLGMLCRCIHVCMYIQYNTLPYLHPPT